MSFVDSAANLLAEVQRVKNRSREEMVYSISTKDWTREQVRNIGPVKRVVKEPLDDLFDVVFWSDVMLIAF